ncbi:MAG: hypothetical protein ACTHNU_12545 [Gaiellales bacterium]
MHSKLNIYRIMGALLVLDVALLLLSGIPALKNADHGWKLVLGGIGWFGFVAGSVALIAMAITAIVRRGRTGRAAA